MRAKPPGMGGRASGGRERGGQGLPACGRAVGQRL
jgi:hypothetical protein